MSTPIQYNPITSITLNHHHHHSYHHHRHHLSFPSHGRYDRELEAYEEARTAASAKKRKTA